VPCFQDKILVTSNAYGSAISSILLYGVEWIAILFRIPIKETHRAGPAVGILYPVGLGTKIALYFIDVLCSDFWLQALGCYLRYQAAQDKMYTMSDALICM
jgi:hypothetical protein